MSPTGVLWAHGDVINDMLEELDEISTRITDAEMGRICNVMCETLFKATQRGNEDFSLAASRQISKVPEYFAAQVGRSAGLQANSAPKPKNQPAAASPKKQKTAPATPKGGGGGSSGGSSSGSPGSNKRKEKATYVDAVGEKGPNGLPRMVGGNPAGGPCNHLKDKGACPFNTCSYCH